MPEMTLDEATAAGVAPPVAGAEIPTPPILKFTIPIGEDVYEVWDYDYQKAYSQAFNAAAQEGKQRIQQMPMTARTGSFLSDLGANAGNAFTLGGMDWALSGFPEAGSEEEQKMRENAALRGTRLGPWGRFGGDILGYTALGAAAPSAVTKAENAAGGGQVARTVTGTAAAAAEGALAGAIESYMRAEPGPWSRALWGGAGSAVGRNIGGVLAGGAHLGRSAYRGARDYVAKPLAKFAMEHPAIRNAPDRTTPIPMEGRPSPAAARLADEQAAVPSPQEAPPVQGPLAPPRQFDDLPPRPYGGPDPFDVVPPMHGTTKPPGTMSRFLADESGSVPPPGGSRPIALDAGQKRELKRLGYTGNDYKQGKRPIEEWEHIIANKIEKPKGMTLTSRPVPEAPEAPAVDPNAPLTREEMSKAINLMGEHYYLQVLTNKNGGPAKIRRAIAGEDIVTRAPRLDDPVLQDPSLVETPAQKMERQRAEREAAGIPATRPDRTDMIRAAAKKVQGEVPPAPTTGPAAAVPPKGLTKKSAAINPPARAGRAEARVPAPTDRQRLTELQEKIDANHVVLGRLNKRLEAPKSEVDQQQIEQSIATRLQKIGELENEAKALRVKLNPISPDVEAVIAKSQPKAPTTGPAASPLRRQLEKSIEAEEEGITLEPRAARPHPDLRDRMEPDEELEAAAGDPNEMASSGRRSSTGETSSQMRARLEERDAPKAKKKGVGGPASESFDPNDLIRNALRRGRESGQGFSTKGSSRSLSKEFGKIFRDYDEEQLLAWFGPEKLKIMRKLQSGEPMDKVANWLSKLQSWQSFAATGGLSAVGGYYKGPVAAVAPWIMPIMGQAGRRAANRNMMKHARTMENAIKGIEEEAPAMPPELRAALGRYLRSLGLSERGRRDEDIPYPYPD